MEKSRNLNDVVQLLLCQQIALDGTSEEDLARLQRSFASLPKHTPRYEPLQILTEKRKSPQRSPNIEVQKKEELPKPLKVPSQNSNGVAPPPSSKLSSTFNNLAVESEKQPWVPTPIPTYSPIQVVIDPVPIPSTVVSAQPSSSQTDVNESSYPGDLPEMNEQAVLARICTLRAEGRWSLTRLPLCVEAPRPKVHHDFFMEEVQLMAVDFRQERQLKKSIAKMLAYSAAQVVRTKHKENIRSIPSKKLRLLKPSDFEMATFSTKGDIHEKMVRIVECPLHGRQKANYDEVVSSERFKSKLASTNQNDRISALNTIRRLCLYSEDSSYQETDGLDEVFRLSLRLEDRCSSWDKWNHLVINQQKSRKRSRSLDDDEINFTRRLDSHTTSSLVDRVLTHYDVSSSIRQSFARIMAKTDQRLAFKSLLPALNRLYDFYRTVRSLNIEVNPRIFELHLQRLAIEVEKYGRKVILTALTRTKSARLRKFLDLSAKFRELLLLLFLSEERFLVLTATEESSKLISEALTVFNVENMMLTKNVDESLREFNSTLKRVLVVHNEDITSLKGRILFNVHSFIILETDLTSNQAKVIEKTQKIIRNRDGQSAVLVTSDTLEDIFYGEDGHTTEASLVYKEAVKRYLKDQEADEIEIPTNFDNKLSIFDESYMETDSKPPLSIQVTEWDSRDALPPHSSSSSESNSDSGISLSYPLFYDTGVEDNKVLSTLLDTNWNEQVTGFSRFDEQQFMDSLSNPWYHGEIIEPDPFAYTDDLSPMEFMDDTQNVHDHGPDSAGGYAFPYSPKSSEDLPDDDTGTIASAMDQVEASLDGFMVERTPPPQSHKLDALEPPIKKGTGQRKRAEESSRKLYGNQIIVLPDPNPIVKPDGKPGFTPPTYPAEWVDADVPPWNVIEDVCLLRAVVSQLKALPLPAYVSRSFCVNWELITRAVKRVSFHQRTPFRCCVRFRELIGAQKKLAPTDNADLQSVTFDGLELPEVFDERVKASTMPITRCFMRATTMLMRKYAELRKTRSIWQKRMDLLHEADETKRYSVMRKMLERKPRAISDMSSESRSYIESRGVTHILPSYSILKAVRNVNPTEPNVVYQQYTKKMRILRVLNTAHGFINKHFKEPPLYVPIQPFYGSLTLQDNVVMTMKRNGWTETTYQKVPILKKALPRIENILERRCVFLSDPNEDNVPKYTQEEIIRIRAQSQHPIDVRATSYPSQQSMADALKLASNYYKPTRRSDISMGRVEMLDRQEINKDVVKVVLDEEIKSETLDSIKARRTRGKKPYIVLSNGIPVLPIPDIDLRNGYLPIRDDPLVHLSPVSLEAAELIEKHGLNLSGIDGFEVFLERFNEEMERIKNDQNSLIWPETPKIRNDKTSFRMDGQEREVMLKISYILSKGLQSPSNYVIRVMDNQVIELHQLPNMSLLPPQIRIPLEWKMRSLTRDRGENGMDVDNSDITILESSYIGKPMYQVQQEFVNVAEDEKIRFKTSYDRVQNVLRNQKSLVKFAKEQFDYSIQLKNVKPAIVKKVNILSALNWKQKLDNAMERQQRYRLISTEKRANEFWLHDRDGDQEGDEVQEVKVTIDPEVFGTKEKQDLVLRLGNPLQKQELQLDQIIDENIRNLVNSLDKCRQTEGGHSSKDLEKDDELKAAVLLEFDSIVANIGTFNLEDAKIKAIFDDEEEDPTLVLTCVQNKNVVAMQSQVESGNVKFNIAVREDPYEDLNEKQTESPLNKYESDTSLLPIFARPLMKDTIVRRLSKWSYNRRSRWLNVLKYRYLRRKTLRLNKTVRSTAKLICDTDPSTSKKVNSDKNDKQEGEKRPLTSTEYRKLAIRKSLATMRKKKGGEAVNDVPNKSPVKLANELACSTPGSGVSTPARSRLPTHQEDTEHPTTPVDNSPQPEMFNTVSELLLATKLKTLDQSYDLLAPSFVNAEDVSEDLAEELKKNSELCAFRFDRQSDDVFVADQGIREVFAAAANASTVEEKELKNPLDVLGLTTMGPSQILKMRAVQTPSRIQKKHLKIKEKLEKEALEFKPEEVEVKKVEEQEEVPEEVKAAPEQFPREYYGAQKRVYTYGNNEPGPGQRVVMVRPGTSIPVHSRQISTGGGQIRTYAVHSQMHPPPQQHFTSAGQPVSIHQPIPGSSAHSQQYVYSQPPNEFTEYNQTGSSSSTSYRPPAIRKDRIPVKQNPSKGTRPTDRQGLPIGRRVGRIDSLSNDPNRELTVKEKIQRDLQLGVNQQTPSSPTGRRTGYQKPQLQRVAQPVQRTAHPTLKRRLEDPGSLQVELHPMETEKRRRMSPSYQGQGYQPVQRISPSTPTDPNQAQIVISQPQTSTSGQGHSYRQATQSQYVVQNPHSNEYAPLEIRLHLQDSQGKPIQCPSSVPTVANVRLSPTGENKESAGPVIEHESSVVPVHTPRGMEYRVQIPRLPDEGRQYQIKLSLPGQSTAQVYGVPEETPVKDVLEMRQPQSQQRGGNRQGQNVQIIQPQGPGGPQYVQFQYNTSQDQPGSSGVTAENQTHGASQIKKPEVKPIPPIRTQAPQRKVVEYQLQAKSKDLDRRPQSIDPKQRLQPGLTSKQGQTRYFSVQHPSSSQSASHADHPIPSTISTTQRNPSPAINPIQQNRQRRVIQSAQRTSGLPPARRGSAQILPKKPGDDVSPTP